jgi:hypothetical protein
MKTNRLQRPQSIDAIINAEKTRKEEPKQTPKQQPTSQKATTYDDEATIIAEPPKEEKESDTRPSSKPNSQTVYQTAAHSSAATTASNNDNVSLSTGCLKAFAIVFVVFFILLLLLSALENCKGTHNEDQEVAESEVTNNVYRMNWESPIGGSQYSGSVDYQNLPHGHGEIFFNDGRYYKGDVEHGVLTGEDCFFKYANGDEFRGKFRNNMEHTLLHQTGAIMLVTMMKKDSQVMAHGMIKTIRLFNKD